MDFDSLCNSILAGSNIYLTGSAGTGKSHLISKIYHELSDRKISCAMTATTGTAAVNIGGITLHSWASIGLGKDPVNKTVSHILNTNRLKKRWRKTQVLFIDEASMLGAKLLTKLNSIAKEVRGNDAISVAPITAGRRRPCGNFVRNERAMSTPTPREMKKLFFL